MSNLQCATLFFNTSSFDDRRCSTTMEHAAMLSLFVDRPTRAAGGCAGRTSKVAGRSTRCARALLRLRAIVDGRPSGAQTPGREKG